VLEPELYVSPGTNPQHDDGLAEEEVKLEVDELLLEPVHTKILGDDEADTMGELVGAVDELDEDAVEELGEDETDEVDELVVTNEELDQEELLADE
jgi:hypothetical protein